MPALAARPARTRPIQMRPACSGRCRLQRALTASPSVRVLARRCRRCRAPCSRDADFKQHLCADIDGFSLGLGHRLRRRPRPWHTTGFVSGASVLARKPSDPHNRRTHDLPPGKSMLPVPERQPAVGSVCACHLPLRNWSGSFSGMKTPQASAFHDTHREYPGPFIFTHKSAFMQRVADLVRTGHQSYVQGIVPVSKAQGLEQKFQERHQVRRNKLEASRARKLGLSTSRLLLWWPSKDAGELVWILLHQHGKQPDTTERWRDALRDRITITGYELVRLTKPMEPNPVWTWRYSRARHDELREQLIQVIRSKRDAELAILIDLIWRTPGFAGSRDQIKKFKDLIIAEWQRSRRHSEPLPLLPQRIGYIRRVQNRGLLCSELLPLIDKADRAKAADLLAALDAQNAS